MAGGELVIFASTPATGSARHKGPGIYLASGVGWGRTHEPNPILVEFRSDVHLNPTIPAAHLALIWVNRDLFAFEVEDATFAHAEHARRVLTRLARTEAAS
jgi:hypothetical protein